MKVPMDDKEKGNPTKLGRRKRTTSDKNI